MSWWIGLENAGPVEKHAWGGIVVVGGSDDPSINVTYNYNGFYHKQIDSEQGIRWLDGKRAEDCVERLSAAVEALGTERHTDYWASTPGNAGYTLSVLLDWARQYPEAVFYVH